MLLPIVYLILVLNTLFSWITYPPADQNDSMITIGKGQQPDAFIDGQGIVRLVYGLEDSLYYVFSADMGKSFTKPAYIASLPEGLMLGMGRGPRIASDGTAIMVAAVNEKGNIYSWKLNPSSNKWEGPVKINDADTVAKEGFVAIARGKGNSIYATWNDLRSGHNQIYGSVSPDGGLSWSKNKLIYTSPDTTICECCKLSMVYDNRDKMYVMWRNQMDGYRDMYLLSFEEGMNKISSPAKLGSGSWKLKACPMDGGSLYSDQQGNIGTIWRRESDLFLCEPGKNEIKVGTGRNPVVVKNTFGTQAIWSDHNEIMGYSTRTKKLVSLGSGRQPFAISGENTMIVFWETAGSQIAVKQIAHGL